MINLILFIAVLFFLAYAILILYFRVGWMNTSEVKLKKDYNPKTKVSIIIPGIITQYHRTNLPNPFGANYRR